MRRVFIAILFLTIVSGCHGRCSTPCADLPASNGSAGATSEVRLISLADSLEPLKARFNAHKDKLRFVAIVSPT